MIIYHAVHHWRIHVLKSGGSIRGRPGDGIPAGSRSGGLVWGWYGWTRS